VSDLSIENEIDLNFMRALLREAGEISLGQRGQMTASVKADHSPVTEVDHQVEDFLIERISSRYPAHQILSEESGLHHARATYVWVIDPIDGTRAFASGLPIWGTSIGILREGIPVAGGLYLPVSNEIYWGTRQAAFYNDQRLAPVKTVDLDSSLVFLGVPSNFHLHFKISYPRIRSLGSTAAHQAYVATGAAVGSLTRNTSLWDIAGMLPLFAAVGIEINCLSGAPFQPADALLDGSIPKTLLAAHPSVMEILRRQIIED